MAANDRAFAVNLRKAAPTETAAYIDFSSRVMSRSDGEIPPKTRELIAIGVALTTQCEMCLQSHVTAARNAGASAEEIAEVTFITAALRAGGAYTHGMKAMRMLDAEQE